jgi:hypothetical protein
VSGGVLLASEADSIVCRHAWTAALPCGWGSPEQLACLDRSSRVDGDSEVNTITGRSEPNYRRLGKCYSQAVQIHAL